ncbi:hypothetical protein KY334_05810 [Candidatus Woesearchaeota archaeon]|nr:hypothetical protein [Candidatus Woesearchaeota archaeon]
MIKIASLGASETQRHKWEDTLDPKILTTRNPLDFLMEFKKIQYKKNSIIEVIWTPEYNPRLTDHFISEFIILHKQCHNIPITLHINPFYPTIIDTNKIILCIREIETNIDNQLWQIKLTPLYQNKTVIARRYSHLLPLYNTTSDGYLNENIINAAINKISKNIRSTVTLINNTYTTGCSTSITEQDMYYLDTEDTNTEELLTAHIQCPYRCMWCTYNWENIQPTNTGVAGMRTFKIKKSKMPDVLNKE